ncbi:ABC transporter substrate-binding protein [Alkalibacter mobilis]|uniref:ABC transporter substrate-binding protein n=1 Tax=Alkalibacter mobilis TaxID=2787712 RepID=UPI00189D7570|nr:ABC transporter substrate-binding protein [Alkalibacter mobilis]MBF7097032.1 ABC transporter substrate-binding protein [Alkalibacter mobilis]
MNNKYFDTKDSLYDLTEKYKEALELLISVGFDNLRDENMRNAFGKSISLENALQMKKINLESFVGELVERIERNEANLIDDSEEKERIKISGVLPCPVKVPLMEAFEEWMEKTNMDVAVDYELKAASMGVDWLEDVLKTGKVDEIPDVFISAGFDIFFDKKLFGKYKEDGVFTDITGIESYNEDFNNDEISLRDPDNQYSIIGLVPAIFLVNRDELKGRKRPETWEDVLGEEFERSISLPVGDFDLFNAILLNIYKNFGEDGIKRLGRNMQKSMHPSEMIKSHTKIQKPTVTVMPYFFTWMVTEKSPLEAVWPKDGAILSPIFMLSKKEKSEKLKPVVDFFASVKVGEILAHNGKFPSVNPKVDNMVPKENKYMWLGWDFIKENDIAALIKKCEAIFNSELKGENDQ